MSGLGSGIWRFRLLLLDLRLDGGMLFLLPAFDERDFALDLLQEFTSLFGSAGDAGLKENHQLDLAIAFIPLLERPTEAGDISQEGYLAADLALLALNNAAKHNSLSVLHHQVG